MTRIKASRARPAVALAALLTSLAFTSTAVAATFDVTRTDDPAPDGCAVGDCSLREAVEAANTAAGDDVVNVPAGTYTLALGQILIGNNGALTIAGAGARSTVIDAAGSGRIFNLAGSPVATISGVTLTGGGYDGDGAAIYNEGTLTIRDVALEDNGVDDSVSNGGAIYNYGEGVQIGSLTVEGSTFSRNRAESDGSAILNYDGAVTIVNSTFTGNVADSNGGCAGAGAIAQYGFDASLEIDSSTIARNQNADGTCSGAPASAGLAVEEGTALVKNTIVAFNTTTVGGDTSVPPQEANCGTQGVVLERRAGRELPSGSSGGNNIESESDCGFDHASDRQDTDPLIAALANNGGQTDTFALLDGSPARDAVASGAPATDQRGVSRPQGSASDIGAFEVEVAAPPAEQPQPQPVQPVRNPDRRVPGVGLIGLWKDRCVPARSKPKLRLGDGSKLARVRVTLDRKRIISRTFRGNLRSMHTIKLPRRIKAGRHRLVVVATDQDGNTRTLRRTFRVCSAKKKSR